MDESRRASVPEPDVVSPVPDSVSSGREPEATAPDLSNLPDEHRDTVRQLHRRVDQAAATIERLRSENERLRSENKQLRSENEHLRRRVEALEEQPTFPDAETILTLDEDSEAVRRRIVRFIDAIDAYLEAAESASHPDETPRDDDAP